MDWMLSDLNVYQRSVYELIIKKKVWNELKIKTNYGKHKTKQKTLTFALTT